LIQRKPLRTAQERIGAFNPGAPTDNELTSPQKPHFLSKTQYRSRRDGTADRDQIKALQAEEKEKQIVSDATHPRHRQPDKGL